MTTTTPPPTGQSKSGALLARSAIVFLAAVLATTFGTALGFVGGVLVGEGTAQRTHQQDLHQFLQLVIGSDPAYSQLRTESGSGTQVFVVGVVPDERTRQQLKIELQRRFGEEQGEDFINQVEITPDSGL
jgi:hypothetical protein